MRSGSVDTPLVMDGEGCRAPHPRWPLRRSVPVVLAGLLLFTQSARAQTTHIWFGDAADGIAYDYNADGLGDWVLGQTSAWIESSETRTTVFVFKLPTLEAGFEVDSARFSTVLAYRSAAAANIDVYGLRVSVSNLVLSSDFVGGTNPVGPHLRTRIQDNWLSPTNAEGIRHHTSFDGSERLGTFLREHYRPGAHLFVGCALDSLSSNAGQYRFNSGNWADSELPTLEVTLRPGTAPLLSAESVGLVSDAQIKDTNGDGFGDEVMDLSAVVFDVGAYGPGARLCGVFVFPLPSLPVGRRVRLADFEVGTESQDTAPGFNLDLWALRVSPFSVIMESDYGIGPTPAGPEGQQRVQADWFRPGRDSTSQRHGTSEAGDSALGEFIRDRYAAGHYLFVRATPAAATPNSGKYRFYAAENQWGVSPDRGFPKLTLITEPSPITGLVLVVR